MKSDRIMAIVFLLIACVFAVVLIKYATVLRREGVLVLGGLALFFGQWAWNCWHDDVDEQDRWMK
ncbi:MAG TPA: hypothetical protein VJ577_01600 [Burkholderiaceae bacterium]|nr:hypothetical protein [Burkholderiaceae bacterium]